MSCHYIVMFERIVCSCQNSLNVIVQRHEDIQEGPFLGPIFFSCFFPTKSKFMLNWRVSFLVPCLSNACFWRSILRSLYTHGRHMAANSQRQKQTQTNKTKQDKSTNPRASQRVTLASPITLCCSSPIMCICSKLMSIGRAK